MGKSFCAIDRTNRFNMKSELSDESERKMKIMEGVMFASSINVQRRLLTKGRHDFTSCLATLLSDLSVRSG